MPKTPRRLGQVLAGAGFAAEVQTLSFSFNNATAADATINLFRASRKMKIRKATYVQTADATAVTSYTCTLRKATGPTALTAGLDIKALAANAGNDFALVSSDADRIIPAGEIVHAFFDETGGTVTAPGIVGIVIEVQLL